MACYDCEDQENPYEIAVNLLRALQDNPEMQIKELVLQMSLLVKRAEESVKTAEILGKHTQEELRRWNETKLSPVRDQLMQIVMRQNDQINQLWVAIKKEEDYDEHRWESLTAVSETPTSNTQTKEQ